VWYIGEGANKVGRVDVSEPASISAGIAERYATAVFEIAKESNSLGALESSVDALASAVTESADLRGMLSSPLLSREEQGSAISALAVKMGLDPILKNVLGLMAQKRRLFVVPQLLGALRELLAAERNEVTAEVISAQPLTAEQTEALSKSLAANAGKTVKLNAAVDESLIGGLIVKVGSKMIDTSIRSKLNSLQNAMKEVG